MKLPPGAAIGGAGMVAGASLVAWGIVAMIAGILHKDVDDLLQAGMSLSEGVAFVAVSRAQAKNRATLKETLRETRETQQTLEATGMSPPRRRKT